MSIKIMSAVWQLQLNHTDKLVLLALADNANDDHNLAWPSYKTLCKKTCLSERGIRGAIGRLSKSGHIQIIERPGHSNQYIVCSDDTPARRAPLHGVPPTPAPDAPHPGTGCPHNHKEPSLNLLNTDTGGANAERSTRKTELPKDFTPDAASLECCLKFNVPVDAALESLRDWAASKRPRYYDWQATFRNSVKRFAANGKKQFNNGRNVTSVTDAALRVAARYQEKI